MSEKRLPLLTKAATATLVPPDLPPPAVTVSPAPAADYMILLADRKRQSMLSSSSLRVSQLGSSGDGLCTPRLISQSASKSKFLKFLGEYLKNDTESVSKAIVDHFEYSCAGNKYSFDRSRLFQAVAFSLRDRMIEYWNDTQELFYDKQVKRANYLSIEWLMGRTLTNALVSTGLVGPYAEALRMFGENLEDIADREHDAALGSGGLGRLAACFLDSLATLDMPAWGYGIRYLYGQFKQFIVHGQQVETPDFWLDEGSGNPWEIPRLDVSFKVGFGGNAHFETDEHGKLHAIWTPANYVDAVAYDTLIPGFGTKNVLTLRLWSAKPICTCDLEAVKNNDPWLQLQQKKLDADITSVLYPKADSDEGKELRLKQEYFFTCASLQDILRRYRKSHKPMKELSDLAAIQLNDTHPAIAIPELMRLLMDQEGMEWDDAWAVCKKTFSFTNHTVLPEALETWSVPLLQKLLPRHLQIIFEINHRFLTEAATFTKDLSVISRLSIIQEGPTKLVRMANLAIVGSQWVNGVAKIHSEILKTSLFRDFDQMWPGKIFNITNGVTQRRWVYACNPALSHVLTCCLETTDWATNLNLVSGLRHKITDKLLEDIKAANRDSKNRFRHWLRKQTNGAVELDPTALFDVHVKRIHQYKRQLLNILGVIYRYQRLKAMTPGEREQSVKRVHIFAGKAAASYMEAKAIIKLINNVADVINADPLTNKYLKVVFISNYSVTVAEHLIPATDLSEHISTAGTEASGTSNMKFCMNAALLLGTMDGANVEIAEQVGKENMFIFGASAEEVDRLRQERKETAIDSRLYKVLLAIEHGEFGWFEQFQFLVQPLWKGNDYFAVAHDFPLYLEAQERVDAEWKDEKGWLKKCVMTLAGMGPFSSDESIKKYASKVWDIKPCRL